MTKLTLPLPPADALLLLNGQRGSSNPSKANQIDDPMNDPRLADVSPYRSIVVADGAWNNVGNSPLANHVTAVLGDGDSLKNPPPHFHRIADQDTTDFEKALQYLIKQHHTHVDVLWASGGEMDHFLGNLSVAARYHAAIKCRFFDNYQCYFYADSDISIQRGSGKTLSIYPFPQAVISSTGLQYAMQRYTMTPTTQQSLRNRMISDNVGLNIDGSVFIFIERKAHSS